MIIKCNQLTVQSLSYEKKLKNLRSFHFLSYQTRKVENKDLIVHPTLVRIVDTKPSYTKEKINKTLIPSYYLS